MWATSSATVSSSLESWAFRNDWVRSSRKRSAVTPSGDSKAGCPSAAWRTNAGMVSPASLARRSIMVASSESNLTLPTAQPGHMISSEGDDDLAGGVTLGEVSDRVGRLIEGIGAVDDRRDRAGLDELGESAEVLAALLGDQAA